MIDLALVMVGVITQYPSNEHPAWDIACVTGRPVYAAHDGYLSSRWSGFMGNVIVIDSVTRNSRYAHLHEVVHPPGPVTKGSLIGTCGNTGAWSYGPHLHFEYTIKNT